MTPSAMHAILITPRLLPSALLRNALGRQNIKSLLCTPSNVSQEWLPSTDAIVFPHPLEANDWKTLLPFLLNFSPKLPLIFLGKLDPFIWKEPEFKTMARQSIILDEALTMDEIPLMIRDIIQKHPHPEALKKMEWGPLTLDRNQRLIRSKNGESVLTKKEFFLLELLLEHPGQIISRELIMEHLWDRNTYVESNTIDVTMSRLRKKLVIAQKSSLIRTIPSLGYKLCQQE